MRNRIVLGLAAAALFTAACKDKTTVAPTPTPPGTTTPTVSRDVKFTVTGDYSGKLDITYIQANGGAGTMPETSVPWTKEVKYDNTVSGCSLSVSGNGGKEGESIVVKILVGGVEKRTVTGIANSSGIVVASPNAYIF